MNDRQLIELVLKADKRYDRGFYSMKQRDNEMCEDFVHLLWDHIYNTHDPRYLMLVTFLEEHKHEFAEHLVNLTSQVGK